MSEAKKTKVSCDGGVLGHPKVYLDIGDKSSIECPYCGKKFNLKKNKKSA